MGCTRSIRAECFTPSTPSSPTRLHVRPKRCLGLRLLGCPPAQLPDTPRCCLVHRRLTAAASAAHRPCDHAAMYCSSLLPAPFGVRPPFTTPVLHPSPACIARHRRPQSPRAVSARIERLVPSPCPRRRGADDWRGGCVTVGGFLPVGARVRAGRRWRHRPLLRLRAHLPRRTALRGRRRGVAVVVCPCRTPRRGWRRAQAGGEGVGALCSGRRRRHARHARRVPRAIPRARRRRGAASRSVGLRGRGRGRRSGCRCGRPGAHVLRAAVLSIRSGGGEWRAPTAGPCA